MARIHADHGVEDAVRRHRRPIRGRPTRWSACTRPAGGRPRGGVRRRRDRRRPERRAVAARRSPRTAGSPSIRRCRPRCPASGRRATSRATTTRCFGRLRVEHFDNAIKMGETAARNMLGAGLVHDDPHWFWSDQYDVQVQMVGIRPPGRDGRRARVLRGPVVLRVLARRGRGPAGGDLDRLAPRRAPLDQARPASRCGPTLPSSPTPGSTCASSRRADHRAAPAGVRCRLGAEHARHPRGLRPEPAASPGRGAPGLGGSRRPPSTPARWRRRRSSTPTR